MKVGLYTFAELSPDPHSGRVISPPERVRDLMEEIELAERVGLDVFGVGEHHRPDVVVSSPAVILGAAAVKTERIRLSSAVTVLSSDDPVRVFPDFATVDLLSGGRAEIMAGRGSFVESFPLFGYDLDDYDELFAEKLELLLKLREAEQVTWSGKHRPVLEDAGIYPRPVQEPLPIWLAVGGTPNSSCERGRPPGAAGGNQLAHVCGGHVARGGRRLLSRLRRDDEPVRARARLVADHARAVRTAALVARRARRRQPAGGRREDPVPARALRPPALHGAGERGAPPALQGTARGRAAGHRGGAGRPGGARTPLVGAVSCERAARLPRTRRRAPSRR